MSQYDNSTDDMVDEGVRQVQEAGKNVARKQIRKASKAATKFAFKTGKKALAAGAKVAVKALMAAAQIIGPAVIVVIVILLICILAYTVLYETKGSEQEYSPNYSNELELNANGYYEASNLSFENQTIREFYRYFSNKSYYQIIGNDNEDLVSFEDDDAVKDYYEREKEFNLSSNLLFTLDEFVYDGAFKYPEQFIKPIYYDPDTLELKDLVDDENKIIPDSKELKPNGTESGNKIKSVADYGLGSIFKYFEATRTLTLEGNYDKKEVWNEDTQSIEVVSINEPFSYTLAGYPEKINLIDKAVTFAGNFDFKYETTKSISQPLVNGRTNVDTEAFTQVYYDTVCKGFTTTVQVINGTYVPITTCTGGYIDLYKHRDSSSGIYETLPTVVSTDVTGEENDYLNDYLSKFETYIPEDTLSEFDFSNRVGTIIETELEIGSSTNAGSYRNALAYFSIIKEMCEKYGFPDPMMIVAMIAQESGGDADVNGDGLMQVSGSSRTGTTVSGQTVTVTGNKKDPRINIEMGVIQMTNTLKSFDGDMFKTIQAYNFGVGGVTWIKENYPESWTTYEWMNYREASRYYYGFQYHGTASRSAHDTDPTKADMPVYGDSAYIEHVMRYYSGDSYAELQEHAAQGDNTSGLESLVGGFFSMFLPDRDEAEVVPVTYFKNNMTPVEINDILTMTKAYDSRTLFSDTEGDAVAFWEESFSMIVGTQGMSWDDMSLLIPNSSGYSPPVAMESSAIQSIITSNFGRRRNATTGVGYEGHTGIDIGIPEGTGLYAVASGVVEAAKLGEGGLTKGRGYYVKIKHEDGTGSLYAHLSDSQRYGYPAKMIVEVGDTVEAGQLIGISGNTGRSSGPHLHFEFHINGNPVDPYHVLVGNAVVN